MERPIKREAFAPEHFIDREKELERLGALLKPERPKSVVLVEGGELMGKTWLLDCLASRLGRQGDGDAALLLPAARIDFWEQRHELQDALGLVRLLRGALNEPTYFSELNAAINLFTQGRRSPALVAALQRLTDALKTILGFTELRNLSRDLGIDYDDLEGGEAAPISQKSWALIDVLEEQHRLDDLFDRMRIAYPDRSLEQEAQSIAAARLADPRSARAAGAPEEDLWNPLPVDGRSRAEDKINEVFFACLRQLEADRAARRAGPVILLFDSVELAPDWAQMWIREKLVGQLEERKLIDVVVIVSGRDITKLTRADPAGLMARAPLAGFDEASIREFLDNYRLPYDDDRLKTLMELSQGGKPGMLAMMTADKRLAQQQKEDQFLW
jgi:hypothetical protein